MSSDEEKATEGGDDLSKIFRDVASSFQFISGEINLAILFIRDELRDQRWRTDSDYGGIDFDRLSVCCAYLERYASCHYEIAKDSLETASGVIDLASLSQLYVLRVVSVGGGPGNDLMSFCSVLSELQPSFRYLFLTVVDLKEGWRQVFERLMETFLNGGYQGTDAVLNSGTISYEFVQADLADDPVSHVIQPADVVLMTKVLSVVPESKKDQILKNIFRAMKDGAVFVFTDIDACRVESVARSEGLYVPLRTRREIHCSQQVGSINRSTYEICVVKKCDRGVSYLFDF